MNADDAGTEACADRDTRAPIQPPPQPFPPPFTPPAITVLYDGACPLCRREIGVYRGLKAQQPVCWADVNDSRVPLPAGTTRAQLLARFHVRSADGTLHSGAQAVLALWAALPGWRWLAKAGRLPGAGWLLERAYRGFLMGRPLLQRLATKLGC